MIFNFNNFLTMNENSSKIMIGDYVFLSDDGDEILNSYDAPWEGSYGTVMNESTYDNDKIYLVKILSEITKELREIMEEEKKNYQLYPTNDDEIWVHVDYVTKYNTIDELKTAQYIFNNRKDIEKYNL